MSEKLTMFSWILKDLALKQGPGHCKAQDQNKDNGYWNFWNDDGYWKWEKIVSENMNFSLYIKQACNVAKYLLIPTLVIHTHVRRRIVTTTFILLRLQQYSTLFYLLPEQNLVWPMWEHCSESEEVLVFEMGERSRRVDCGDRVRRRRWNGRLPSECEAISTTGAPAGDFCRAETPSKHGCSTP